MDPPPCRSHHSSPENRTNPRTSEVSDVTAVGICGFGTIGKRVADAVRTQPDMELVGAAKRSSDYNAVAASNHGIDLYAAAGRDRLASEDIDVSGDLDDLVTASDVIVDTTPAGVGEENRQIYEAHNTPAIFQGGEAATVGEASFNALANFDDAIGASYVRVVSCNTTGLSRLLVTLDDWGVESVHATMIRRGADPAQVDRGPIDDIVPDPVGVPSHHAPDVNTVLPDVDITTFGLRVPATKMHVQCIHATLKSPAAEREVRRTLEVEPRIATLAGPSIESCGAVKEYANDIGRPRGDVWENVVWTNSLAVDGRELYLMQAIHQESIVVPENVDAIRAVTGTASARESRRSTDEALGVGLGRGPERVPAIGD